MKRFSNVLRLALCVSVLAVALSVPMSSPAVDPGPPGGLNVNVVNTPSNPVPVTLQGTGTVSGNVAVTNTPNVNVVNTSLPVSDVDNAARSPFQISLGDSQPTFTVPSDKRLVIEFVSGSCEAVSGVVGQTAATVFAVLLDTKLGFGSALPHFFVPTFVGNGGPVGESNEYKFAQQTRMYADPGTNVSHFRQFKLGTSGLAPECHETLSGYLINP